MLIIFYQGQYTYVLYAYVHINYIYMHIHIYYRSNGIHNYGPTCLYMNTDNTDDNLLQYAYQRPQAMWEYCRVKNLQRNRRPAWVMTQGGPRGNLKLLQKLTSYNLGRHHERRHGARYN